MKHNKTKIRMLPRNDKMVRINSKGVEKGCSNTKGARLDIKNSFSNNRGTPLLRIESILYIKANVVSICLCVRHRHSRIAARAVG